jgi:hypothetical protein
VLGFLARRAVRAALRPAVRAAVGGVMAHEQARRQQAAWYEQQQRMQSPWWLIPSATGDSALYYDRRASFTQLLPGWPSMTPVPPAPVPGEPPCDQLVVLQEIPVSVRYRLTGVAPGWSAAANARAVAEAHAGQASGARPRVTDADEFQLRHWCVEAAVMTSYALARPDTSGADAEDLLVLVRRGSSMQVTTRYSREALDWLRLALLRSVALPGLVWDESAQPVAREAWPTSSTFLAPGLTAPLTPLREQILPQLVPQFAVPPREREALSAELGALITREEPPWAVLPRDAIAAAAERLVRTTSSTHVHAVVRQALGEVHTAHDIRGAAIWMGRALELAASPGGTR